MAGTRIICLISLCLSAVINAETKNQITPGASAKYEHSTTTSEHASQVHSYQGNGHSRAERQVTTMTSAPSTTNSTSGPSGESEPVQTTAQTEANPSSVGESGSGNQTVDKEHVNYPTYTGILPDYMCKYRTSESRYRKLLTGLSLYNLGMLYQNSTNSEWKDYVPDKNVTCEFGIRSDEVSYKEVDIDCRLITYFIQSENNGSVPVPVLTTKKEVVKALDPQFNGDPIPIEPSMRCYMKWGNSSTNARVKDLDCKQLHRSEAATKIATTFLVVVTSFVVLLLG